jgi:hypothetical protein
VGDLVNVIFTPWTEDDTIFIHEDMRDQMTFLILSYCFTGARLGAYLHHGKGEVKRPDGKVDKLVFEALIWKVRENPNAVAALRNSYIFIQKPFTAVNSIHHY